MILFKFHYILKEYVDPFTGEPVIRGKKKPLQGQPEKVGAVGNRFDAPSGAAGNSPLQGQSKPPAKPAVLIVFIPIKKGYIQEKNKKSNAIAVSEEILTGLINKSRDIVKSRNILECRNLIGNYVESVTIYKDKVEIKFKINVPDESNNALNPLKIEYDLNMLKAKYKNAV